MFARFLTRFSACRTLKSAEALGDDLSSTTAISLDVNDTAALETAVAAHDLVISLIPYTYHAAVIEAAIKGKTHVVTTSYISPAMRALDKAAKEAGIVVMNEIGLDPGIDHLYAIKTIDEVHEKGGKVIFLFSFSFSSDTQRIPDQAIPVLLWRAPRARML
jgi:spermidine synthase